MENKDTDMSNVNFVAISALALNFLTFLFIHFSAPAVFGNDSIEKIDIFPDYIVFQQSIQSPNKPIVA